MAAEALKRNWIEQRLLPSDSWIDRHPFAAVTVVLLLIVAAGGF